MTRVTRCSRMRWMRINPPWRRSNRNTRAVTLVLKPIRCATANALILICRECTVTSPPWAGSTPQPRLLPTPLSQRQQLLQRRVLALPAGGRPLLRGGRAVLQRVQAQPGHEVPPRGQRPHVRNPQSIPVRRSKEVVQYLPRSTEVCHEKRTTPFTPQATPTSRPSPRPPVNPK